MSKTVKNSFLKVEIFVLYFFIFFLVFASLIHKGVRKSFLYLDFGFFFIVLKHFAFVTFIMNKKKTKLYHIKRENQQRFYFLKVIYFP
jgi:hypothetical protein